MQRVLDFVSFVFLFGTRVSYCLCPLFGASVLTEDNQKSMKEQTLLYCTVEKWTFGCFFCNFKVHGTLNFFHVTLLYQLHQWFPKWAVPPPWGR